MSDHAIIKVGLNNLQEIQDGIKIICEHMNDLHTILSLLLDANGLKPKFVKSHWLLEELNNKEEDE